MNWKRAFTGLACAATLFSAAAVQGQEKAISTRQDTLSYALGVNMVTSLRQQGVEIDLELAMQGMRDAAAGKLRLSDGDIRKALSIHHAEARKKRMQSLSRRAEENKSRTGSAAQDPDAGAGKQAPEAGEQKNKVDETSKGEKRL